MPGPGSITPKGTGQPDYRRRLAGTTPVSVRAGSVEISGTVEHIRVLGTAKYIGTLGRILGTVPVRVKSGSVEISGTIEHLRGVGTLKYVGSLGYQGQLGTVRRVGTVRYVQAGSIGHITVIGSLARIGRLGTVENLGTLRYLNAGSIGHITAVGSLQQLGRIGTVQRLGTVRYIQAGSIGRVERVGTVGQLQYIGTISQIRGTVPVRVKSGTVETLAGARRGNYTTLRGNVRLGAGSAWLGSWQYVGSHSYKTLVFKVGNPGTTGGGSIAIITGQIGTGVAGLTGTFFGPVRIGKGTYTPLSLLDPVRYLRLWIRQHGAGAVKEHGGTVSASLGALP